MFFLNTVWENDLVNNVFTYNNNNNNLPIHDRFQFNKTLKMGVTKQLTLCMNEMSVLLKSTSMTGKTAPAPHTVTSDYDNHDADDELLGDMLD